MKKDNKLKFAKLLEKRRELSKKNQKRISNVSSNDPQLVDILNNFNEGKDYKSVYKN